MSRTLAACPPAFDQCLRLLAAGAGLGVRAGELLELEGRLFDGFEPAWLERNLKFDLSLSAGPGAAPGVRFSYNNFGEAAAFRAKIGRVFELWPGAYDLDALGRVLDVMQPTTLRHQTTLGFDWNGAEPPRIKVYFEELHHAYDERTRRDFAAELLAAAGERGEVPDESLAALAVDFHPGRRQSVKLYSLFRSLAEARAAAPQAAGEPFASCWARAELDWSLEPRAFYYLTRRLSGGALASLKLYKIYEFAQFASFEPAFKEIAAFWSGETAALRRVEQLAALVRRHGERLCPVIVSLDTPLRGPSRSDAYFAIRPEIRG